MGGGMMGGQGYQRSGWGWGQGASRSSRPSNRLVRSSRNNTKKSVSVTCMAPVVTAREDALVSALQARKSALVAAWALTDDKARRDALKDAWEAFRDANNAAWRTYRSAAKACGADPEAEGPGAMGGMMDDMMDDDE